MYLSNLCSAVCYVGTNFDQSYCIFPPLWNSMQQEGNSKPIARLTGFFFFLSSDTSFSEFLPQINPLGSSLI